MDKINYVKPPIWFWIVAAVGMIWNLMGVGAFVSDAAMNADTLASLPEAQQALYAAQPFWVTVVFGLSVATGVLGCLLLFLKKSWAGPMFLLSLILVLVQSFYMYFLSNTMEVMGAFPAIMNTVIIIFAVMLMFFARHASGKRWIR